MGKVIDFGRYLRERREAQGMTTVAAAQRAHVDDSTISRYENGSRTVSPDMAVRLSKAYRDPSILYRYCDSCPVAAALRAISERKSARGA